MVHDQLLGRIPPTDRMRYANDTESNRVWFTEPGKIGSQRRVLRRRGGHGPQSAGAEEPVVEVSQASRLRNVTYNIRGPVLRRARQLEAEGHQIIKLNLGKPAPFGLPP